MYAAFLAMLSMHPPLRRGSLLLAGALALVALLTGSVVLVLDGIGRDDASEPAAPGESMDAGSPGEPAVAPPVERRVAEATSSAPTVSAAQGAGGPPSQVDPDLLDANRVAGRFFEPYGSCGSPRGRCYCQEGMEPQAEQSLCELIRSLGSRAVVEQGTLREDALRTIYGDCPVPGSRIRASFSIRAQEYVVSIAIPPSCDVAAPVGDPRLEERCASFRAGHQIQVRFQEKGGAPGVIRVSARLLHPNLQALMQEAIPQGRTAEILTRWSSGECDPWPPILMVSPHPEILEWSPRDPLAARPWHSLLRPHAPRGATGGR